MGRAPCCDKANVKKGPWSPEEDAKLKSYIEKHGTGGNWIALPQKVGLKRCGKSCRLRWLNYLRPNLKHGGFSEEEDRIICSLYVSIGSRWSVIAAQLPGRTDNDIKNYWNTRLKKKLLGFKHRKEHQNSRNNTVSNTNVVTIKQEESNTRVDYSLSSLVQEITPQESRWPHVPVLPQQPPLPFGNQFGTCFNDQEYSIKKLLVKLGGRFPGDYDYNLPHRDPVIPTVDMSNLQFSSGAPPNSSHYQELVDVGREEMHFAQGFDHLVQGQGSNFTQLIEEMGNNNNYPHKLDGLEFFSGESLIDDKIIGSSICTSWGETSNSIYHHGQGLINLQE